MNVLSKGIVVVPHSTSWTGPWLGATRATSLQRVANRPILCHVLDALLDAGVLEVAVVAAPDASEEIAACIAHEVPAPMTVTHIAGEATGADVLRAVVDFLGQEPGILHRADGLLGQPLQPLMASLQEHRNEALLVVSDMGGSQAHLRLVPAPSPDASGQESPPPVRGTACACMLAGGVLARVASDGSPADLSDFASIVELLAGDGGSTQTFVARKWRHFTGDALALLDLNRTILDTLRSEATVTADSGNRFEGQIEIHPTACVTSSVIVGPVVIGAEAQISDSYIGPHTSIAERVRIEGAELERSIVLADASVLNVGGRLVASIVGRQARIFRDFSVPRALRLQVGDGDEVALC